jgi:CO/xanthine dehydrogenase Mo-binding subunit
LQQIIASEIAVIVTIPAIIALLENISRGIVSGASSALHEAIEIDRRRGRYHNTDLAEDIIPVNADIEEARVILKRRPR